VVERATEKREFVERQEIRHLAHAVDHSTPAAAAEDHRVRALERFHALEVVQIPVVLHVVAHAIEVEVGGRAVAADDHLVAVVLALVGDDPRHVADDVSDAGHHLVADQFLGHDGDRLRHVAKRRRRLRAAADDRRQVAGRGADVDRFADAGDLQHELAHVRRSAGSRDGHREVEEATRRYGNRVAAGDQGKGELAVLVRDGGGSGRRAAVRDGGDAGADDGGANGIDDTAADLYSCLSGQQTNNETQYHLCSRVYAQRPGSVNSHQNGHKNAANVTAARRFAETSG
jgi:hypothetical protein